ncbi:hypothetical protein HYH02_011396 [Chlamydomonas schloesseri]|uniref:Uncharacterized protein n=1 Tax=Chlamydomonas schloesseri TaxID=2026947 RepID=A0A835W2R2_9CHLO|nr:hypothetical protein HYH02_011396 [Chlamydomonas schloesseri]|eukprot:KAG2437140.1 hypothetical protein HYH02_011396 [Chlamydomonas schloesseri]
MAAIGRVQKAIRKAMDSGSNSENGGGLSLQSLAEAIASSSFLVTLRTGLPLGCESPDYLSTLRHSFLIVQERQGPSADLCIVVDPNFREQFTCIAMPGHSVYAQTVANNVPQFFVGTIGTVNALVCLLQSTLAEEAQALGLELPPWRSRAALLSKWLPRRFTDSIFMPPTLEANLHPLLKSSLAGGCQQQQQQQRGSPTGVQSWQSSQRPSLSSSRASSSDGGGCSSACSGRPSPARLSQPQTVVVGFSTTAAAANSAASVAGASCPSASSAPLTSCSSSSSSSCSISSHRAGQPRPSALSQQLAAAAEAARSVQAAAADQWARLEQLAAAAQQQQRPAAPAPMLALAVPAAVPAPVPVRVRVHPQAPQPPAFRSSIATPPPPPQPPPQQQQEQRQTPAVPVMASQAQHAPLRQQAGQEDALTLLEAAWSSTRGTGSGGGGCGQLLQALVVSPVHRRAAAAASGGSSLRRSGAASAGGSCAGLKLAAPLKQLPRIYTVKLAVAAC